MTIEVTTSKPIKSPRTRKALMDLAQSLVKEKHIEQTCSEWLELDGWRTLKTDPVSRKEWGKGFGELGMADRLYIRYDPGAKVNYAIEQRDGAKFSTTVGIGMCGAQVMWIEWKSKDGTVKPHQWDWHAAERARGGLTLIAGYDFPKTIEGFQACYRRSGLMRRKI